MSSNIRPEIQRFCNELTALTTSVDRETRQLADKNKKMEADVAEKIKTLRQKETQLKALENETKEIEAQSKGLDAPIREYKELELQYQELHSKESVKLDKVNKIRKELLASQANGSSESFNKLQNAMNSKMELLTMASKSSQETSVSDERKRLEDKVYHLEQEVKDLYKEAAELKMAWNQNLEEVFGTDEHHRSVASKMLTDYMGSLRNSYIKSKLEMHKLKKRNRSRK